MPLQPPSIRNSDLSPLKYTQFNSTLPTTTCYGNICTYVHMCIYTGCNRFENISMAKCKHKNIFTQLLNAYFTKCCICVVCLAAKSKEPPEMYWKPPPLMEDSLNYTTRVIVPAPYLLMSILIV